MITDDARRDRLSVVTEQSVKPAARHASEYFRKTDTNAPAATSRYSSGESRGITRRREKRITSITGGRTAAEGDLRDDWRNIAG
jgi:hypothetical protein